MKAMLRISLLLALLAPVAWASTEPAERVAASGSGVSEESRPALPVPPDRRPPSRNQVKSAIERVARRYGVEEPLVRSIVAAESNYNAHAVSSAGAVGLMQLMPSTAADYGVGSTQALFDAETNLRAGTRHLKRLLRKYGNDYGRVIMAYNAGEGVVDRTNSRVTYLETLNYTEAVIRNYRRLGGKAPTQAALRQVQALRGLRSIGQGRRLMKKFLDPSLLSLKVKPTLDVRFLDPSLHDVGPESRPMFELDARAVRQ